MVSLLKHLLGIPLNMVFFIYLYIRYTHHHLHSSNYALPLYLSHSIRVAVSTILFFIFPKKLKQTESWQKNILHCFAYRILCLAGLVNSFQFLHSWARYTFTFRLTYDILFSSRKERTKNPELLNSFQNRQPSDVTKHNPKNSHELPWETNIWWKL